jgi:hypothetical protein
LESEPRVLFQGLSTSKKHSIPDSTARREEKNTKKKAVW